MMSPADLPWRAQYWFGKADPRPFALFRILFGLGVCHDLLNYARDLRAFVTDQGMLPRAVAVDPYAWGMFALSGDFATVALLFGLGSCAVVAFTLGFHTQIAAALSWLFLTSLVGRNPYVTDGGDDLVRCLMFIAIFADLGGCWSLDNRVRGKPPRALGLLGPRFLQLHIVLLYFCAARLKFRRGWLTENVIYQCLQLTGFVRPPGHFLLQWPELCRASTVMVLGFEFVFAFLALSPVRVGICRGLAVAAGAAVQIGILLTMRVGVFTETMLSAMALFMCPEWFDWLATRVPFVRELGWSRAVEEQPSLTWAVLRRSPMHALIFGLLSLNFIRLAWGPFIGRRIPAPSFLTQGGRWLWLDQPFGLFDVIYPIPRWYAHGVTRSGFEVEVISAAVPDLVPVVRWRFSRWYKFTFKEGERPYHFAEVGAYLCRAYAENTGIELREFTLFEERTPPALPGAPASVPQTRQRWHQVCAGTP